MGAELLSPDLRTGIQALLGRGNSLFQERKSRKSGFHITCVASSIVEAVRTPLGKKQQIPLEAQGYTSSLTTSSFH